MYVDRKGKIWPKKIFSPISDCCRKKCTNTCKEDDQKSISKELHSLSDPAVQDQILGNGIQIMGKGQKVREEEEKKVVLMKGA